MKKVLFITLLLLLASAAYADTTYNNTAAASGSISDFGYPNTATYGETFAAPATGTTMNSFSLFLNAGSTGQLEGYVASWTGTGAGRILYTSSPFTVNGSNQEFTFNTGGLNLTPGALYVAFISISQPSYNSYIGYTTMPSAASGSIPGGGFVYINNGSDTSQFTSSNWGNWTGSEDAEFIANFGNSPVSATPEPSSFLLLGTGLAGCVGAIRRKLAK